MINTIMPSTKWTEYGCPLTVEVNAQVSGAAVLYQFGKGAPGAGGFEWSDAAQLLPGPFSLRRRCDALRFRSQRDDAFAVVSFEALTPVDLGEDAPA